MNAETFLEWREQNSFYFKNQISQFLCMISLDLVRYTPHDYNYTDSIEGRITEDKEPEREKAKAACEEIEERIEALLSLRLRYT